MAWPGLARRGKARPGMARQGMARRGKARQGIMIKKKKELKKKMKKYKISIKGTAPLIQNKVPEELGEKTEKRGEGKDSPEMCEHKLYTTGKKIVQPAIHLENALVKAGTTIKQKGMGKKTYKDMFKGSVFIRPDNIVHENQEWEVHKTTVVIPSTRGRTQRYRPILNDWSLSFEIEVLDDRLSQDVLKLALDEAGRTVGIGDWRPRYGRFMVTEFKAV